MEHTTLTLRLIPAAYAVLPQCVPAQEQDTPYTSPLPHIHACQPLPPHNIHRRRDTLPGNQCVPPVFSYQRITSATGNTSLLVRKKSSRRNIPHHFIPISSQREQGTGGACRRPGSAHINSL